MPGAEARGNAQPDFAALNLALAEAPLLQQQQQADRDTCKDHPVPLDTIKGYRSAHQGEGDVANQSGVGLEAAAARLLLRLTLVLV
jgi:hypothetical protein